MKKNIDLEVLKQYVKINVSKNKVNTRYSTAVLLLVLLNCAWACKTVHAIANAPNEDTVFYRLKPRLLDIDKYLWDSSLEMLRKKKHTWKRRKVFLSVDETHEGYSGKFRKVIDWIFGYTQKRGETGSFRFLVFSLVSFNQRLVVRAVPVKIGQNINPIIRETAEKLRDEISYKCVLLDRGFYKSELVKMLQETDIPFIIRAKIPPKIKKYYDFKKVVEGEFYDFQGVSIHLVRMRDAKSRKYGFLTNLPEKSWQKIPLWYKQRWDIENVFLACDGIHLKTNSKKIELRFFCVVFSLIIYNLRSNKKIQKPLLEFCLNLINYILSTLKIVSQTRKPPNLNIPGFSFIIK